MEVIGFGKDLPVVFPPHSGPGFRPFHSGSENLALPADLHLLAPIFLRLSFTDRPVDEPAEVSHSKLPGRTGLPEVRRAFADLPAGADVPLKLLLPCRQKKHLALDERRDLPPSLLEALHGADRGSQEISHLLLGFLQAVTKSLKFSGVHKGLRSPKEKEKGIFPLDSLYHIVLLKKILF